MFLLLKKIVPAGNNNWYKNATFINGIYLCKKTSGAMC